MKEYTLEVLKGWWPEFSLIGTLPAYGIYARLPEKVKELKELLARNINRGRSKSGIGKWFLQSAPTPEMGTTKFKK